MAGPEQETAVVVVQDRSRQNAIVGTIDDQIKAFDQIAANLSSLGLNGWDTTQKCKAACWIAHGAGMHPAIFIQNHYVMTVQGRLLVEPKWEFIVGILQSRVPGFKFEVLIETDDCAEVRMTDSTGADHTVRYSLDDARRQGLLGRGGNAWTSGNTREMCLKQAIKRCGRRIGAAALMDLPVSEPEIPVQGGSTQSSVADVISSAIEKAGKKDATDVAFEDVGGAEVSSVSGTSELTGAASSAPSKASVPEATSDSARQLLAVAMVRFYGKLSKAMMAEKVNMLYNVMMLEKTGVNPNVSFKPGQIGPVEAAQLVEYLEAKLNKKETGDPAPGPAEPEEEAPPTEEAPPAETGTPVGESAAVAYHGLMVTVARARRLFERKFIKEAPASSGKFWFTDQATLTEAGDRGSVKIQDGGIVCLHPYRLDALSRILAEACDAKERGGR